VLGVTCQRSDHLYRLRNVRTEGYLAYTNKIPTGSMRGFGNPKSHFAIESLIDMAAVELGLDPAWLRSPDGLRLLVGNLVPEGATPVVGFDLTTHRGHFMGNGHNRLVLYTDDEGAWVKAAGTWDPMPWHIGRAYRMAGSEAQHAFWGQGGVERLSMLHQLAQRIA
jgi:hypothetical protein